MFAYNTTAICSIAMLHRIEEDSQGFARESAIVTIHVIFAAQAQSDHIAVYTYRN